MILGIASGLVAKILGGGAILAYLYSLYSRFQVMAQKQAQAEAQVKVSGDLESDSQKAQVANEKVVDFNQAVTEFNNDNKPGSSS